jgi:hypothetical protein
MNSSDETLKNRASFFACILLMARFLNAEVLSAMVD